MCLSYQETDWFTSFHQSDFSFAGIGSMTGLLVFSQFRPVSTLNGFCLLGFVTALAAQVCLLQSSAYTAKRGGQLREGFDKDTSGWRFADCDVEVVRFNRTPI